MGFSRSKFVKFMVFKVEIDQHFGFRVKIDQIWIFNVKMCYGFAFKVKLGPNFGFPMSKLVIFLVYKVKMC